MWSSDMVWNVDRNSSMWVECAPTDRTIRRCPLATAPGRLRRYHRCFQWVAANNHNGLGAQCQPPGHLKRWISKRFSPNWCHFWIDPWPRHSINTVLCALLRVHQMELATNDAKYSYKLVDAFFPILHTSWVHPEKMRGKIRLISSQSVEFRYWILSELFQFKLNFFKKILLTSYVNLIFISIFCSRHFYCIFRNFGTFLFK